MEFRTRIDILLATFNGEPFLSEQLDSVFDQTYQDFQLIVRDDGSTDQTSAILKKYQEKFPDRIKIINDNAKNLGATQNFARLLEHASADYISFCDQDDIWIPEKLEISLNELQRLEKEYPGKPCMVYSDMKLIDEKGNLLQQSVWKQLDLDPQYFTFNRLLIQNIPHGCTMLLNRAMKELASPIPSAAMLHDHWIAIISAALGEHAGIIKPLVLLRNHSQNVTRKQASVNDKINRYVGNVLSDDMYEQMVQSRVSQAMAIRDRFFGQMSAAQRQTLDQFISLGSAKGIKRKMIYLKNGFFRTTFRHTLKMILRG